MRTSVESGGRYYLLVYAEGVNGAEKKKHALEILKALPRSSVSIPIQVLGELFQVLVRKANRSPQQARNAILTWVTHSR